MPIGGGQMDIDHLHGGILLWSCSRSQPRFQRTCALSQIDSQAVRHKGDKDMVYGNKNSCDLFIASFEQGAEPCPAINERLNWILSFLLLTTSILREYAIW